MSIEILDDDCLLHIFEYLPLIEIIKLEETSEVFEEATKTYYRTIKTLECNYRDMSLENLVAILTRIGPFMTSFKFFGGFIMKEVYKRTLFELIEEQCRSLTALTINYVPIDKDNLVQVSKISHNLKELDLGNCHIEDSDLSIILIQTKNVKRLKLNGNPMLTGSCLTNLNQVLKLDVSYCYELNTEELIRFLKECKTLKSLNISGSFKLNWKEIFTVLVEYHSDIEELHMLNLGVDGAYVPYERFTHLKVFEIKGRRLGT